MEIEACIPPPEVRFRKICMNYALRSLQMHKNHPIAARIPSDFPPYTGTSEYHQKNFLKWKNIKSGDDGEESNESENEGDTSESGSDYQNPRRKRQKKKRKNIKMIFPSQLTRLIGGLKEIDSSYKNLEKTAFEWSKPWAPKTESMATITVSNMKKKAENESHKKLINELNKKSNCLIFYTDGSKMETQAGAGITSNRNHNQQWSLGKKCEVFDAELFALQKASELAIGHTQHSEIWIFSDSQAALKRIQKNEKSAGQSQVFKIQENLNILAKKNIQATFQWVPSHTGIEGNDKADELAKKGTRDMDNKSPILSISYVRRKIKEKCLDQWEEKWSKAKKGRQYEKYHTKPKWKADKIKLCKKVLSSYMQLKLGHGFFRTYIGKIDRNIDLYCNCGEETVQNPTHLVLECKNYRMERKKMFENLDNRHRTMEFLFSTRIGREKLVKFIEETKIASRQWWIDQNG
jgi:Ribonuclease HI